jgi:leader peptidase (prepilin peptidase)/N-methyltransferase
MAITLTRLIGYALLSWLLVALAALDAEFFWLPDWLTLPGIAAGLIFAALEIKLTYSHNAEIVHYIWLRILSILASAGIVLVIRLTYWLVRRREGMGLGDAKLMALLGAWFSLGGAMECFILAIFVAALAGIGWLIIMLARGQKEEWATMPLPLGSFLAVTALLEIFSPDWLFGHIQLGL